MIDVRNVIVRLEPTLISHELADRVEALFAKHAGELLKDVLIAGHRDPQQTTLVWPPKPERRYFGVLNMVVSA